MPEQIENEEKQEETYNEELNLLKQYINSRNKFIKKLKMRNTVLKTDKLLLDTAIRGKNDIILTLNKVII